MHIIEVEDLWFKYQVGRDWALKGVSLRVERGEYLGIVGPSAAGKTTLCMCLNGLIPHYVRGEMRGRVEVCGLDTRRATVPELSKHVQVIFQDASSQLIMSSVEEELVYPLVNLRGLSLEEARREAREALRMLGIEHLTNRHPRTCSGGEKQRVLLALALALRPEVLVVDEATSDLDPEVSEVFFKLSRELNEDGCTLIVVSHDTDRLAEVADRIVVMDGGRVVAEGDPREVFSKHAAKVGVRLPEVVELAINLSQLGVVLNPIPLSVVEAERHVREKASG